MACLPASTRLFLPLHEVEGEPFPPLWRRRRFVFYLDEMKLISSSALSFPSWPECTLIALGGPISPWQISSLPPSHEGTKMDGTDFNLPHLAKPTDERAPLPLKFSHAATAAALKAILFVHTYMVECSHLR